MSASLALYRKYRSRDWSEVVGQEHVVKSLQNAIKNGRVSHAYLFIGPRGVGKTTVARILARQINKLAYEEGVQHLDIIEIDAASNRRIDEIRELRDKIHVAPTSADYKVYIIDEVHMLTKEAFNALLKTLEEPPAHAVFILATTEPHKLPATIVSRTQRHTFHPLTVDQMLGHLRQIAKAEKIKTDDEALTLIAEHGQGSFRDSISLLDQVRNHEDTVTAATVRELLGLPNDAALHKLLSFLESGDSALLVNELEELRRRGYTAATLASQLFGLLRQQILEDGQGLLGLMDELLHVPASQNPEARLELALLKACLTRPELNLGKTKTPEPEPEPEITPPPAKQSTNHRIKSARPAKSTKSNDVSNEQWQAMLKSIKAVNSPLYAVLRMAEANRHGKKLTLAFAFSFHQQRALEAKNLQLIADSVKATFGEPLEIVCVVNNELNRPPDTAPTSVRWEDIRSPAEQVIEAFGGGERVDL